MTDVPEPPKMRFVGRFVPPTDTRAPSSVMEEVPVIADPVMSGGGSPEVESSKRTLDDHLGDDAVASGGLDGHAVEDGSQPQRHQRRAKGDDYEVGYGKPPREHQFPRGRSPNPKGRPKGSLSLKTEVKLVVSQPVAVTENGKRSQRSTLAALLMKLRADALAGKPKAVDQLIKLIITHLPDEVANDYRQTAAEDAALLARFKKRKT